MKIGPPVMVGKTKIQREMAGLPVYEMAEKLHIAAADEDVQEGSKHPRDCDLCAVSLATKRQLHSPLAHIGKAHAYVAVPHPLGKKVNGSRTKYVVLAAILGKSAQKLMRDVDLGKAEAVGQVITLLPRKKAERPGNKAKYNKHNKSAQKRRRPVREEGVRNYSGRGWAR